MKGKEVCVREFIVRLFHHAHLRYFIMLLRLWRPLGGLELLGVRSIILLPALVIILCTLRLWGQAEGFLIKLKNIKGLFWFL